MTAQQMDAIVAILTEASPKSIFLEVAFLESWVASHEDDSALVYVHERVIVLECLNHSLSLLICLTVLALRAVVWLGNHLLDADDRN